MQVYCLCHSIGFHNFKIADIRKVWNPNWPIEFANSTIQTLDSTVRTPAFSILQRSTLIRFLRHFARTLKFSDCQKAFSSSHIESHQFLHKRHCAETTAHNKVQIFAQQYLTNGFKFNKRLPFTLKHHFLISRRSGMVAFTEFRFHSPPLLRTLFNSGQVLSVAYWCLRKLKEFYWFVNKSMHRLCGFTGCYSLDRLCKSTDQIDCLNRVCCTIRRSAVELQWFIAESTTKQHSVLNQTNWSKKCEIKKFCEWTIEKWTIE